MRTANTTPPGPTQSRPETVITSHFQRFAKLLKCPPVHSHFKLFDPNDSSWEQRKKLRQTLVNNLPPAPTISKLLQPGKRPELPGTCISLSHCPIMGGFIFAISTDTSLGLDIEQSDRVSWRTVARVSDKREVEEAPHPALLWSAKEAAVKSLPPGVLMSKVTILGWQPLKDGYRFTFPSGHGVAFQEENVTIGCACVRLESTGEH